MSFDPNSTNPYAASPSTQPTAPKKSNVLMYVLLGIGAVVVIGCCGCAGMMMFGGNAFMQAGMNLVGEQIKPSLQADPVVQEHIGDIKKISMNFTASTQEAQRSQQAGEPQRMVFDVEGTKGKGQIIGTNMEQGGQPRLKNAELRMSTGETYPLTP
jgi:hypothetical protein